MATLLFGVFVFFGVHCVSIVNESWRDRMASRLGEWPWKGVYGLVALFGLIVMIRGYAIARHDAPILYTPPLWLEHVALLLFLPVFPLLVAAYFPGRIKAATTHPMLLSVKLWAVAHLLVIGSLPGIILFMSFLVWAVVDRISLQRRQKRPIPGAPPSKFNDLVACLIGLGLYVAFLFWLHASFIGVSPFDRAT